MRLIDADLLEDYIRGNIPLVHVDAGSVTLLLKRDDVVEKLLICQSSGTGKRISVYQTLTFLPARKHLICCDNW